MQVVESNVGKLTFRLPNIAEGPELLALCGLNSKNATDEKWLEENDLLIVARIIKNMGILIKDMVINGTKIKSYEELLEISAARNLVMEMAYAVLASLGESEEKNV